MKQSDMKKFKKSGAYSRLYNWLFKGEKPASDTDIAEAKKKWDEIGKDNSDPVLAELNWLNYFQSR